MIRSWKVKNFKAVQSSMAQLQFGDITIFAGANSSGKSTIIQSLLLMMQSLSSRDNASLVLNGDLVSLGTVGDVWFKGRTEEPILFEMTLDSLKSGASVYCELYFLPSSSKPNSTHIKLVDGYYALDEDDSHDFVDMWHVQWGDAGYEIVEASPLFDGQWRKQLTDAGFQEVESPIGSRVRMQHFLPRELLGRGKVESHEVKWPVIFSNPLSFTNLTPEDKANHLPDDLKKVLDAAIQYLELPQLSKSSGFHRLFRWDDADKVTLAEYMEWFSNLPAGQIPKLSAYYSKYLVEDLTARLERWYVPQTFDILSSTIHEYFTSRVRYLSANRVAPTALFSLSADNSWSEVGIDGGRVAAAINEHGNKRVMYWHPQTKEMRQSRLIEAVLAWLQYFGLVEDLKTVDFGKLGTFLNIKVAGMDKEIDLTAVGFGTSQILPIIVQGLLTPRNGLFIVEQPEVHLHPKVQSQLAHFFFALTQFGVQCIIETHSEYIVNQLRVLLAQGEKNLQNKTQIYFANRDAENGTSFEAVRLKGGQITNWPEDFMDEGHKLAQELLETALQLD